MKRVCVLSTCLTLSMYLRLINQTICTVTLNIKALCSTKEKEHSLLKLKAPRQFSKPYNLQGHSMLQKCMSRDAFPYHRHSSFDLSWYAERVSTNVGCAEMQEFGNFLLLTLEV